MFSHKKAQKAQKLIPSESPGRAYRRAGDACAAIGPLCLFVAHLAWETHRGAGYFFSAGLSNGHSPMLRMRGSRFTFVKIFSVSSGVCRFVVSSGSFARR